MNIQKIIAELQEKYPGKKIIKNMNKNPTEILCEIEPTENHPDYSVTIAVIDKSIPHYHKKIAEEYKIIKGVLKVYKGNTSFVLAEGQTIRIEPNIIHHAEGRETWIVCTAKPGWTKEDHIIS